MKKLTLLLLIAVFLASHLAGCGSSDQNKDPDNLRKGEFKKSKDKSW